MAKRGQTSTNAIELLRCTACRRFLGFVPSGLMDDSMILCERCGETCNILKPTHDGGPVVLILPQSPIPQ